jgi:hypothetical protein
MLPGSPRFRALRLLSLFILGLVLFGTLPFTPAQAQLVGEFEFFDNTQGNFADGVFQRTAVSADVSTFGEDVRGAVQLAPAGILNPWRPLNNLLPSASDSGGLYDFGLVALGKYLFTVVGSDPAITQGNGRSDQVYSAEVDQRQGALVTNTSTGEIWRSFTVPAGLVNQNPNCVGVEISARTRAAVAAVEAPAARQAQGVLGYIYVIGGSAFDLACEGDITSSLVQIATVNTTGAITGWSTLPANAVPNAFTTAGVPAEFIGLEGAMATIVRTSAAPARTFLYVFGGISIDPFNFLNPNSITKQAIYTEIDLTTGALRNPTNPGAGSVWVRANADGMPLPPGKTGLRNGTAMATRVTRQVVDNTTTPPTTAFVSREAIFVAGGCFNDSAGCSDLNPFVYRADVDPATGQLTWTATPGVGSPSGVQVGLEARSGQAGLAYGNKLYLIGGSSTGEPNGAKDSVPTAFLTDNAQIDQVVPNSATYFVGINDQVLTSATGPGARFGLAAAIVPALPPANETDPNVTVNAAWAFAAGGRNPSGQASRLIFVGRLGGDDEAQDTVRVRDGWYYSNPIPVDISGATARVVAVRWQADIDRSQNTNADMRFEFRKTITATGLCAEDSFSTTDPEDRWRLVDGDPGSPFFSRNGTAQDPYNLIEMDEVFASEQVNATCLQYRVRFLQNGENPAAIPNPGATPRLLNFSVKRVLSGSPDLKLKDFGVNAPGGRVRGVRVTIENLNDGGINDTWDVSEYLALTNAQAARGNFFVNLCLARADLGASFPTLDVPAPRKLAEGEQPIPPPCSVAWAPVNNTRMTKGAELTLTQWFSNATNEPIDIRTVFSEPGRYTVGVVIDYYDVIPEGVNGELNNRGETEQLPNGQQIQIEITGPPEYVINLPIIRQPPPPATP